MLALLILGLLAIGRFYPGSGADSIGWRPTGSPQAGDDDDAQDIRQMLDAQNERRRRKGLPERTEEQVQADVDAFERELADRAAGGRARRPAPPSGP